MTAPSPADKDSIAKMVDRFLGWVLPKDFSPDCGIKFTPLDHPNAWPVGTNLLTADQAQQMFEHSAGRVLEELTMERNDEFLEAMNLLGAKDGETLIGLAHRLRTERRYQRAPEYDRRTHNDDDYAGDAFVFWVAVGQQPRDAYKIEAPLPESQPINAAPASATPRTDALLRHWKRVVDEPIGEKQILVAIPRMMKELGLHGQQLEREVTAHEAVRDACFEALGPECRVWGDVPGHIEELKRSLAEQTAIARRETAAAMHYSQAAVSARGHNWYEAVADAVNEVADAAYEALRKADIEPSEWDGDNIVKDVKRGLALDIARLAARSTSGLSPWVLVEDRLPDNGDPVVVFEGNASHMRRQAYYDTIGATGWHWCGYEGECNPDAWMPIPMFSRVQSATQERKDG